MKIINEHDVGLSAQIQDIVDAYKTSLLYNGILEEEELSYTVRYFALFFAAILRKIEKLESKFDVKNH